MHRVHGGGPPRSWRNTRHAVLEADSSGRRKIISSASQFRAGAPQRKHKGMLDIIGRNHQMLTAFFFWGGGGVCCFSMFQRRIVDLSTSTSDSTLDFNSTTSGRLRPRQHMRMFPQHHQHYILLSIVLPWVKDTHVCLNKKHLQILPGPGFLMFAHGNRGEYQGQHQKKTPETIKQLRTFHKKCRRRDPYFLLNDFLIRIFSEGHLLLSKTVSMRKFDPTTGMLSKSLESKIQLKLGFWRLCSV